MESAASTTLIAWATVTALAVVGGAALVLFAPLGREPGRIALMSSIVAYPTCLLGGLLYIRSLKRRRNEIYARWLAKLNR